MNHQQLQQRHPATHAGRSGDRLPRQQRHQGITHTHNIPANAGFPEMVMSQPLYQSTIEQPGPATGGRIPNAADSPAANLASSPVMHPPYHTAMQHLNQPVYPNHFVSMGPNALSVPTQATNSIASRLPSDAPIQPVTRAPPRDKKKEQVGDEWSADFFKSLSHISKQGPKKANSAAAKSSDVSPKLVPEVAKPASQVAKPASQVTKPASQVTKLCVESEKVPSQIAPEEPPNYPEALKTAVAGKAKQSTSPVEVTVEKHNDRLNEEVLRDRQQEEERLEKAVKEKELARDEAKRKLEIVKKNMPPEASSAIPLDSSRSLDRDDVLRAKAISRSPFTNGPSNSSSQQNASGTRAKPAGAPLVRPKRETSSGFPSQKMIYEVAQLLALKEDNRAAPEGFSKMEISSIQGRNNLQHGKQGSFRGGDGPVRFGSGPISGWGSHGATSGNSGMNTNLTVSLPKAKNAWVRGAKVDPVTEAIQVTNGVLNKLTNDNLNKMVDQMIAIKITSLKMLKEIVNCIYEKATLEPRFCEIYAKLASDLHKYYEVITGVSSSNRKEDSKGWDFVAVKKNDDGMFYWSADGEDHGPYDNEAKAKRESVTRTNFRVLIVEKCEHVFRESGTIGEATALLEAAKQELMEAEMSGTVEEEVVDKIRLKVADLHYKEVKVKRKRIGNVQFSGELFKRGLLREKAMQDGVAKLILLAEPCSSVPSNEDIELTCKLLSTIGSTLETSTRKSQGAKGVLDPKALMDKYIGRMKSWKNLEPRIRFMIADLVDLRLRGWKEASAATTVKSQAQSVSADRQSSNRQGPRQSYGQHNSQSSSVKGNINTGVAIAANKHMIPNGYVVKGRDRSGIARSSTEKSKQPMNTSKFSLASNNSNLFSMNTGMMRDNSNQVLISKKSAVPEESKEDIEKRVKDLKTSLKDAIDLGENENSIEYIKLKDFSHAVKAQFLSKVVEDIFYGEKKYNMVPSAIVRAGVLSKQFNLQDLIDSMESQLKKMYDLIYDAPMMPTYISEFVCKLIPDVFKITEFWKILERVFSASEKENYSMLAKLCVEFLKQQSAADAAKIESDFNLAEVNFLLKNEECSALMKDLAKEEASLQWFFRKL